MGQPPNQPVAFIGEHGQRLVVGSTEREDGLL